MRWPAGCRCVRLQTCEPPLPASSCHTPPPDPKPLPPHPCFSLQAFRAPTSRDLGPTAGDEDAKGPGEQWIEEDMEEDPAELAHHRMMKEDLNHVLLTLSEVRAGLPARCWLLARCCRGAGRPRGEELCRVASHAGRSGWVACSRGWVAC